MAVPKKNWICKSIGEGPRLEYPDLQIRNWAKMVSLLQVYVITISQRSYSYSSSEQLHHLANIDPLTHLG